MTFGVSGEVTDAYEEWISRMRSAEEARDLAARRKPRTGEAALIPRRDVRERIEDTLAGLTVRNDGSYEMHGPVCSDDIHSFVVRLSPVGVAPKNDQVNKAASTVFTTIGIVASCVPLVGWALAIPPFLIGLLFGYRSDRANRSHLATERRLREAEEAADRPWRWWLSREGPEPWLAVVTDDYQRALTLGIHHPARDISGGWVVAQTERALADAVAMGKRMLDEFTY